jgi:hypothetical protein
MTVKGQANFSLRQHPKFQRLLEKYSQDKKKDNQ